MGLVNKLRDVRFEMKMEQNDFSSFLGVNPSVYNRWERNKQQPSLEWAVRISLKTGRDIRTFIEVVDDQIEKNIDGIVNFYDQ